jgi:hypothetical protein
VADSLRCPRLLSLDWRVDALVSTSALGQVRRLGSGAAGSGSSEGGLGEAVTSLRLGLSHAAGTLPQRAPASDAAATPLLLGSSAAARAAAATAAAAAAASASAPPQPPQQPPRMGTPQDLTEARAAMAALGIRPLDHHTGLLGVHASSASSASSASGAASALHAEGVGILSPTVFVDCTLSADAAAALLAELRVANAILQKTAAALPPSLA